MASSLLDEYISAFEHTLPPAQARMPGALAWRAHAELTGRALGLTVASGARCAQAGGAGNAAGTAAAAAATPPRLREAAIQRASPAVPDNALAAAAAAAFTACAAALSP